MTLRTRKLALILFALIGITLLCTGLWLQNFVSMAITPAEPQTIEIKSGSSFGMVH